MLSASSKVIKPVTWKAFVVYFSLFVLYVGRMRDAQLIINVFLHIDICCILCSDTGGLSISATAIYFSDFVRAQQL